MSWTRPGKSIVIAVCALILLGLLFALPELIIPRDSSHTLPSSQTYGIVLIDIGDPEDETIFHVSQKGVYVLAVEDDSPASLAGILPGDRIVEVNHATIQDSAGFSEQCMAIKPGTKISITLIRGINQEKLEFTFESEQSGKENV